MKEGRFRCRFWIYFDTLPHGVAYLSAFGFFLGGEHLYLQKMTVLASMSPKGLKYLPAKIYIETSLSCSRSFSSHLTYACYL